MNQRTLIAMLGLLLGVSAMATSGDLLDALLQRAHQQATTQVVPDAALRRWDPITLFFASDRGRPGPEDHPEKVLDRLPEHPGAWTWLDARTLQFRPAEPWTPLASVSLRVDGRTTSLFTMASPPIQSTPSHGARGLAPFDTVELTFADPLPTETLARLTRVELRPLPGLTDEGLVVLDQDDFEIKTLPRQRADDPVRYALVFTEPIPRGLQVRVHLGLSLDAAADEAVTTLTFATSEPFRATQLGCGNERLPLAPSGSVYAEDQALGCTQGSITVRFNAEAAPIGPVLGRNLVRFEPAIENLRFETEGRELTVRGDFAIGQRYRVALEPTEGVRDRADRPLQLEGPSVAWLRFEEQPPYLRWGAGQGIVERFGPHRVPIQGRGVRQVDLRVYEVDPTNRELWPFPDGALAVDESVRPPGPGEEPRALSATGRVSASDLRARLGSLGSPGFSGLVDVGLAGPAARSGLDLSPAIDRLSGRDGPGHFLVGMRRLDGEQTRSWMRVQVTDLALSTLETGDEVRFLVTSLSTGRPVSGARITVEGVKGRDWVELIRGTTDADGGFVFTAPGTGSASVQRLLVRSGDDTLVLDARNPPDAFADGRWRDERGGWLDWAFRDLRGRVEQARLRGHLFAERPMYRPEEDVHLKGYLRRRYQGDLTRLTGSAEVEVSGPGGSTWRLPVQLTDTGSFYTKWSVDDLPTGVYRARVRYRGSVLAETDFQVEAYRLPTFEVDLAAADNATTVPNDTAFEVTATGSYYVGGKVALRPVRWRVTQFPYRWEPPVDGLDGFLFSSDGRYARSGRFDSTPALERAGQTDRTGEARLRLDPGIEPTAQPRTYVIEAEVTGADEQTVTATQRIHAVPAFVLGLKAPRFRETADRIPIELVSVGPDGALLADRDVTVRLIQRQWHSVLQASDFSDGVARYVTDTVDVVKSEQTVRTGAQPTSLALPIDEAGVYVVELEARDALGRVQVVGVDLYAGGKGQVTWAKPEAGVFEVTPDAPSHAPGDTAKLVIRSPFQSGTALVVIEAPKGNQYKTVSIQGGKGTVSIPIREGWVPRIPVHVLLRRGRVADAGTVGGTDLGKPQTLGSTHWLTIEPVEHTVQVAIEAPERAMPGQTVPMTVTLADPKGRPLSGEVTLWLVDQAVLALAPEKPLDPRPAFLPERPTRLVAHDTRNLAFGALPFSEMPGGDGGEEADDEDGVLDQTSVRQDFQSVPYYEPALRVGPSGKVAVQVKLPDNLTVFQLRAKATSGEERFGHAKGSMAVRLPVLLQADLPRFVRPGDSLEVAALGRVVEGDGGAGSAEVRVEGLTLTGPTQREVAWSRDEAARFAWPVTVPTPEAGEGGALARKQVTVTIGAKRSADGAGDAVKVQLPLLDDRRPRLERVVIDLPKGGSERLEALDEEARPGSLRRTVVVADHPGLVKMAAAMDVFVQRPARSVGQQLDRGRAWVGLGSMRASLGLEGRELVDAAVAEALGSIPGALDSHGLVAAWPGGRGQVGLTADALRFVVDAQEAGYTVDPKLRDQLVRTLKGALRSDYRYFLDGGSWLERSQSLEALSAAGALEASYLTELADRTRYLGPRGTAHVLLAAEQGGRGDDALSARLVESLDAEVVTALFQGQERYQGLKSEGWRSPWIDASEALTLATVTRSLVGRKDSAKLPLVVDGLVRLGGEDGWGGRADAPALLALAKRLQQAGGPAVTVQVGGVPVTTQAGTGRTLLPGAGAVELKHVTGPDAAAFASSRWIPAEPGSQADARNQGFVVSRDHAVYLEGSSTPSRVQLDEGGRDLTVALGGIVEDHLQVVNPEDRAYVAVEAPLAAGLELMNPALATASSDAKPSKANTREATYVVFGDASVTWYFEQLPKGTYDFYFRSRATTRGRFVQPPAFTEAVYDGSTAGSSPGASVRVE